MTALTFRNKTLNDAFYQTVDFRYRVLRPLFNVEDYAAVAQALRSAPTPPSIEETTARYRLVKMVMAEDAAELTGEAWKIYAAGSRELDFAVNTLVEAAYSGQPLALYELAVTIDGVIDEYCAAAMAPVLSGFRKLLARIPMPAVVTRVLKLDRTQSFDVMATQAMEMGVAA